MIPVYEPLLDGNEKRYLCEAIDEGEVSGSGRFVQRFEKSFARWAGTQYAVAVCNGTCALETALWSAGFFHKTCIPAGTIISCYQSARRISQSIELRDNWELGKYEYNMRVHLFGILDQSSGTNIVDDCSQYWDKFNHYHISCYSLYANKLITSGEGGVIVTSNKQYYENALMYRNLSHSKERFVHEKNGYNFRMSNLQGAVALAQLEQIERFTEIKQRNRDIYLKHLPDRVTPLFNVPVPWMYLVETCYPAEKMVEMMERHGVECRRFFHPIHKQPCIVRIGQVDEFEEAEFLRDYAFYLPSGLTLTKKEIKHICLSLSDTLKSMKRLTRKSRTKKK